MTVFYFWETPTGSSMPGYIELCLQTWQTSLPNEKIVRIDYGNVSELTDGLLPPQILRRYSYAHQSDIICAVVLAKHGGVFLDADTILTPAFSENAFDENLPTFFGTSKTVTLAAMIAPKPELPVFVAWRDRVMDSLRGHESLSFRLHAWMRKNVQKKTPRLHWSHFGGLLLDPIVYSEAFTDKVIVEDIDQAGMYPITELLGQPSNPVTYQQVWLTEQFEPSDIVPNSRFGLLLLQNSWNTPEYNALSPSEVLEDKTLLSKTLQMVLGLGASKTKKGSP